MPGLLRPHQEHGFPVRTRRLPILRGPNRRMSHLPQDGREANFIILDFALQAFRF